MRKLIIILVLLIPVASYGWITITPYADDTGNFKLYPVATKKKSQPVAVKVAPITKPQAEPSPAPEPASMALVGAGLIGLACWRRRKNKNTTG